MKDYKTKLFPAIDMSGGRVVRLKQGDYDRMTVYDVEARDMAFAFDESGAEWVHLVNLDGAKDGKTDRAGTSEIIKTIKNATSLSVEIGGGIRTQEKIEEFLLAGADRVVLGTVAVKDPDFTEKMIDIYGSGIAIGIDIKEGKAAINGWTELSSSSQEQAFRMVCDMGAETIICTDVARDGIMAGIDYEFYEKLVDTYTGEYGCGIVASGGVTTLEDIRRLSHIGLEGIIVGKALYYGSFTVSEALKAMEEEYVS